MKKILLVSGCSFTTKNFTSIFHPDMICDWPKWPEILGEKLNMDVINLGQSGSGNEYIFSSLIDAMANMNREEIGLVIPAWSQCLRRDWIEGNFRLNMTISDKGDLRYHVNKSMRYYYLFQFYCETNSIPYKQLQMIEFIRKGNARKEKLRQSILDRNLDNDYENGPSYIKNSIYYDKIKSKNFIGYPMKRELGGFPIQDRVTDFRKKELEYIFRLSKEDAHPSKIGHEMIAEYLYENI